MWSPGSRGTWPDGKYALWRMSAGLRRLNQLAAVAEFRFLADWPLYPPKNLNLLDFSIGSIGRPEGQAMPHANLAALHLSVAAE
jgi:hypothetical protein